MKDYAGDVRRFCDLTGVKLADATPVMIEKQHDEIVMRHRCFLDAIKALDSEPTDERCTELLSSVICLAHDLIMFTEMWGFCETPYAEPKIDVDENVSYINETMETFTPDPCEYCTILNYINVYINVLLIISKFKFNPQCINGSSCASAARCLKEYCATQGFDFDGAWDAMHEANMNRFYHDENGKLVERKDYKRPDLAKFIGSEE